MPYSEAGLLRCDAFEWKDARHPVLVRLSKGRQFLVPGSTSSREFKVPCDLPGIAATLMATINGFVGQADAKTIETAFMAAHGSQTLAQTKLAAPLLDTPHP